MLTLGLSLALAATPALAHGKGGLGAKIGVSTGKGGIVGALLGGHGRQGLGIGVKVGTGRGGILGLLLGGGGGHAHGGHGCGC
jgi:hypothetical protein